ncbi:hypothetical protein DCS_06025 [Drechmeria coniospora]|uniref:Uncharacterized protein n=1 Tax=Drechmeria coniospora TaxID=98403 RepID=A0A151GAE9_DRECN|nr:hypothetical protein DCS_06025 [Drechmeria coniospora]KYK54069.1 hypothetical protein DCS_06025 [Drechmeria coniospora]
MALPLCRALTRLVPLRCAARPRLPPLRRPHSASSGKTNPSSAPSAPAAPKLGSRPGSAPGFGPGAGPRPAWRRRLGLVTSIVEAYGRAQRARPYRTQLVGAVFVYLAADLGAQHIGGREYDPIRTGRSLLIGLVAAIPYYKW